jgi:hypothetical protein
MRIGACAIVLQIALNNPVFCEWQQLACRGHDLWFINKTIGWMANQKVRFGLKADMAATPEQTFPCLRSRSQIPSGCGFVTFQEPLETCTLLV